LGAPPRARAGLAVPRGGRAHRVERGAGLPAHRLAEQRPRGPDPAGHRAARDHRQDDRLEPGRVRALGDPPMGVMATAPTTIAGVTAPLSILNADDPSCAVPGTWGSYADE